MCTFLFVSVSCHYTLPFFSTSQNPFPAYFPQLSWFSTRLLFCRRRKSSSPLTPAWRPPTSPKGKTRRRKAAMPSRTHSVEGLLETAQASLLDGAPSRTRSTEGLVESQQSEADSPLRSQTSDRVMDSPSPPSRTHSSDALLESTPSSDDPPELLLEKSTSLNADLDSVSDSVTSSSDTLKRKRNFMDRCVNKMRSLIKK